MPRIPAICLLALSIGLPGARAGSPPPEVVADWLAQDSLKDLKAVSKPAVLAVLAELGDAGADLRARLDELELGGLSAADVYLRACERRREARLQPCRDPLRRIVFTKSSNIT